MANLLTFSLAGLSFLLFSLLPFTTASTTTLRRLSLLLISSLFLLHSLLSSLSSSPSDPLAPFLPLSLSLSLLPSVLYSLSSLLLPSPLLPFLLLSSLVSPLLLLLLRRRDPDAIESRYFDLLALPFVLLLASSLLSSSRPRSQLPRLSRAAALALIGTWLIQMGFSLFSPAAIAHGCFLHRRSYSNYTVRCKGHPEYHRARAIATLQFNCHLALLVVVGVAGYSFWMGRMRREGTRTRTRTGTAVYRPLSKELRDQELARFSVDDDEEEDGVEEIKNVHLEMPMSTTENIRKGFGNAL